MALDSTSTFADALAQFNDNLGWVGNPTKAADLHEAALWLLANRPQTTQHTGLSMTHESLDKLRERLEEYLSAAGSASKARRASFVRARGLYP